MTYNAIKLRRSSSDQPQTGYITQAHTHTDEWIIILFLQLVYFIQIAVSAECAHQLLHVM
jgi:hypothetical protein